jgi:hypothetical protein
MPLPRIVTENFFAHSEQGKRRAIVAVFELKKEISELKEELHGWETKYTDHLGR